MVSGAPASLSYLSENAEVIALIGTEGQNRLANLVLEPGTFLIISIKQGESISASGKIRISWEGAGKTVASSVTFDKEEAGVSSAIIDVGNYQLNEFYGVPIFHHFHQSSGIEIPDFRVKTSESVRIEAYDSQDQLLFIDANGNGSFLDPGDIINHDADKSGYPDLPIQNGEAIFRLQVYPRGAPSKEGIKVAIEVKDGDDWTPMSVNHLSFPESR